MNHINIGKFYCRTSRLAQANLASKNDFAAVDFDDKLKTLNKKLVQIKQNMHFLENEYFTSDDGFQNIFVYQHSKI